MLNHQRKGYPLDRLLFTNQFPYAEGVIKILNKHSSGNWAIIRKSDKVSYSIDILQMLVQKVLIGGFASAMSQYIRKSARMKQVED